MLLGGHAVCSILWLKAIQQGHQGRSGDRNPKELHQHCRQTCQFLIRLSSVFNLLCRVWQEELEKYGSKHKDDSSIWKMNFVVLLCLNVSHPLSLPYSSLLVKLQLCIKHLLWEQRSVVWKSPTEAFKGCRSQAKSNIWVWSGGEVRRRKSFHPSSPVEDFCSCQNASQGFGEWVSAGDRVGYILQRSWLQYPSARPSGSPLLL